MPTLKLVDCVGRASHYFQIIGCELLLALTFAPPIFTPPIFAPQTFATIRPEFLITNPPTQGVVVRNPIGAKLNEALMRYEAYGLSGTFLVSKDGQIVLHKGYGLADRERGVPNTPATLFEMGSITKTFTAAAILRLEMQGKLKTDDLISRYLGDFPKPKSSTTIYHLLAHKSGLIVEGASLSGDGADRDRFIRDMKDTPAESLPGEKYRYTNAGYSVLAAIIEKVSGEPYESFVRDQLFKPAGLTNTGFRGDFVNNDARLARGYLGTPERIEEGPPLAYLWGTRGAGGIISTVGDMHKWLLAEQGDKILSVAAKNKAFAPSPTEQYGWHVQKSSRGTPLLDKGGGQVNFATHILYFPSEKLAIVYASNNLQQRWRRTLNAVLPKIALGENYELPPPIINLEATTLNRYTGSYSAPSRGTFQIRAKEGYLYVTENSLSLPVSVLFFPQSRNVFTGFDPLNSKVISLRFEMTADGSVKDLIVGSAAVMLKANKLR